ncbi:MAG TPA: hypothetical protein VIY09_00745, partial [Rhizomicrobium sp.]
NGTEGILTEYSVRHDLKSNIAIETFDQSTGKIIKIIDEVKNTYGDFVAFGVVGKSVGLVEYQPERKFLHLLPFKYELLDPLDHNRISGDWKPQLTKGDRLFSVSESQGYSTTAMFGFNGGNGAEQTFVFGSNVANNTFGPLVPLEIRYFSYHNSPVMALDTATNDAIVAAGLDVPELAVVDLVTSNVNEFAGLGAGHVDGIAVDSADGIACTTTLNDYSVEFYDLANNSGFLETLPGAGGETQAGQDVQFDPVNKLFLIDQPNCSQGPGACIEVYDTQGNWVKAVSGLDSSGHIAFNPNTRTGFMQSGFFELQSFSY